MRPGFWGGFFLGVVGVFVYHHFVPGKGIGQPGQVGG
jgi:hypothetical protein